MSLVLEVFCEINGGIVRGSTHFLISECPSTKENPQARLWYDPGRSIVNLYNAGLAGSYPSMCVMKFPQLMESFRWSRKTQVSVGPGELTFEVSSEIYV